MAFDYETLSWKQTRYPGIALVFLYNDSQTDGGAVLIRMEPGCGYPRHRHVGDERVLVLQGGYHDEFGEYRTGQDLLNPAGSEHHPVAAEGDLPCILLAAAEQGIELLDP